VTAATVLAVTTGSAGAQQHVDRYSIPAASRYNPAHLRVSRPLTRAERTNFTETSHDADVIAFIDSLKLLGAHIVTGSIGTTAKGNALPYVIASRPLITTPQAARAARRPVVYVQANIHGGEVEGKEAMQSLLRDLLFDPHKNVLDSIVLIVQPNYNADGNEQWGPQAKNRGAQNGPELVGTRHNAQDWNLNRDYVGASAPETRASMAVLNTWNPDLFMDLHTTDGSIHGYGLTYSPPLTPGSVTVNPYLTKTLLPEIRRRMLDREGFEVIDYGDFSRVRPQVADAAPGGAPGGALGGGGFGRRPRGPRGPSLEEMIADSIPTSGWTFSSYEPFARYGTNWYGLRGRMAILSEAFSHDPFDRRVASTYDFVSEILSYVAENAKTVLALGRASDSTVAAWAAHPGSSPAISLESRMDTTRWEDVRVEEIHALTDSSKREAGMGNRQRTGIIKLVHMPVMASFTPTLTTTLPYAYAFDASTAKALLPILRTHGVRVERLTAPARVTAQTFTVDSIAPHGRAETPRDLKTITGTWQDAKSVRLPAGSYVVRAGQPYGLLALYLLEPQSEDGLAEWSFYDGIMSAHAAFPVVRITKPATIHSTAVTH
jgi:hypothetical protein